MTSSISWIDPDSLMVTVARIGGGRRRSDPSGPAPRHMRPAPALVEVSDEEEVVELVRPTVSPVAPEPESRPLVAFAPPAGALKARLEAFVGWLLDNSGCSVAFIVDRDGLPLVEHEADADLLAIAASVMQLIDSINGRLMLPVGQSVTLELERDQLMLTAVDTPIGKYIVGQVGARMMGRELRSAMAEGLRRTFRPGVESPQAVAP
jgi:predicted regulator of Ras-like GTPase activity (Roadblock/LC7/MglB family)